MAWRRVFERFYSLLYHQLLSSLPSHSQSFRFNCVYGGSDGYLHTSTSPHWWWCGSLTILYSYISSHLCFQSLRCVVCVCFGFGLIVLFWWMKKIWIHIKILLVGLWYFGKRYHLPYLPNLNLKLYIRFQLKKENQIPLDNYSNILPILFFFFCLFLSLSLMDWSLFRSLGKKVMMSMDQVDCSICFGNSLNQLLPSTLPSSSSSFDLFWPTYLLLHMNRNLLQYHR